MRVVRRWHARTVGADVGKLTADDRKTLTDRKYELDQAIDGWRFQGVRSLTYDRMVAERDRVNAALLSGEIINIGDTIRPKCKHLAQIIADAIARLQEAVQEADAFAGVYADVDDDAREMLEALSFPPDADPRERTSGTSKWLERAARAGLIPR